eukprot:NODE_3009_length_716_cov_250.451274_g2106_i1.p1 GENE.NODE_3009_length_716_cov_250.451274_g2106_i1~~NODE_3009_length_716_cov_250.451274_g2106_i1.p1  ORF type:complete len:123 (+),score=17.59 NODE_3009_length_716_cov_250.451274_g2106_i1:30-371(+)
MGRPGEQRSFAIYGYCMNSTCNPPSETPMNLSCFVLKPEEHSILRNQGSIWKHHDGCTVLFGKTSMTPLVGVKVDSRVIAQLQENEATERSKRRELVENMYNLPDDDVSSDYA